ncbi:glycerophosphoryl diester phosphodiesterase [Chelatococcus asaccharovorans]|uniref:Glycerophosphoryl diester phosphodiesterase n=1 Tax=Chelatococcus asaccharovorans TaxID=28210 RepID=A0A2V3U2S5_9HYPH|nr:glycerophosphodiester phosphodiesterase family protein [Chelatococcus asaccharovorans]PXW57044.1 glycerophosphoryl diester phosphodiesterase [Chelatococcus asaccharovorans]
MTGVFAAISLKTSGPHHDQAPVVTRPLAIAHRGYSARYPENTLEAYRAAIAAGADIVETDARLAADGVVVACHDPTLARLAGRDDAVADLPSDVLLAMPLAQGAITTLAEALATICPQRPALIDVKTQDLAIIDAIAATVSRAGAGDRVWIGVRDHRQATEASRLIPGVNILAFLPEKADVEAFARAGARAFRVWEGDLGGEEAERLLARRPVWVTAGGPRTGRDAGDIDGATLSTIIAKAPQAVLVNDPTLLTAPSAAGAT